ncbi:MAG TPA: GtrA family protein [Candidatus Paceibacterota bacterium]|nr:GtrA family protein [Candidatus Paceibacterota bacterium]
MMYHMAARIDRKGLVRFFRYSLVGGSTFAFDLLLIWVMTELFGIPYYISTFIGFVIAVSLNYFISRRFVFKGTERKVHHGYAYFLSFACAGAFLISAAVAFLTETFHLHYMLARVLVACVVGVGNYLFNLHFNFKVAGRHH